MPRSWHASSDESSDSDEESDALGVRLWLDSARRSTVSWPLDEPPPSAASAVDDNGQWGAKASGVAIRTCDDESKGYGAFAERRFVKGAFVGVYRGEQLTQREYAIRHTEYDGATAEEQGDYAERLQRIASLTGPGAPAGGVNNHGAYVFSLIPTTTAAVAKLIDGDSDLDDEHVSCIDAEDPTRSSWCRYINHAQHDGRACNLSSRVVSTRALVWFEALRDVEVGEELCFSYGPEYSW